MGVWSFLFNLDIHNIHKIKLCLLQISEEVLSVEDDLWLLLFPHVGSMHLLIQTALRLPQLRASSSSQAVVTHTSRTCLINTWAPCLRVVSSAVTRSAWPSSAPKTLPPALTAAITCPASRGCRQTASTSTHSRANTLQQPLQAVSDSDIPHTTLWATTLKAPSLLGRSLVPTQERGAQDDPHRSTLITHTTVNLGLVSAGSEPSRPQPRLRLPQRWTHASIPPIAPGSPASAAASKTSLKSPGRTPGWKPPQLNRWTQLTQVCSREERARKNACRLTHPARKIPLPTAAQRLAKRTIAVTRATTASTPTEDQHSDCTPAVFHPPSVCMTRNAGIELSVIVASARC